MAWEESMFAVFDDLEQQAAGLHLAERDVDVADLALAEYSEITAAARLHASLGRELRVRLVGGHAVSGRLARVGEDWLLLADRSAGWIIRFAALCAVAGLSAKAESEEAWPVVDRLSMRAVLRRLAEAGERCLVHFVDDHQLDGQVRRVGRDFFELQVGEGQGRTMQLVPVQAVAALQGRTG